MKRNLEKRTSARVVFAAVLLALFAANLNGCSFLFKGPDKGEKLIELAWPEPPLKARIRFVGNLVSGKELEQGISVRDSLLEFLAGQPLARDRIANPMGVAVSEDAQRVYATDLSQGRVFVFDLTKKELRSWDREQTKIGGPLGIAVDAEENVYVVDSYEKVIRVFDRAGKPLRAFSEPELVRPTGIVIDSKRDLVYVSDTSHQHLPGHYIKKFNRSGQFLGNVGKGKGMENGYLLFPTYLALDPDGNLYVADTMNARVQVFDPEGNFVKAVGERGNRFGQFERPKGLALDSFGNLHVADSGWANVQIFNKKGEVLLFFGGRGRYPGLMNNPSAMAIDKNNRIYVADVQNRRLNIYQLVNTSAEDSDMTLEQAGAKNALAADPGAPKSEEGSKEQPSGS